MKIRNAFNPEYARSLTTEYLRQEFLIGGLFIPGDIKLVYSHFDRIIVGGICPRMPLSIQVSREIIGSDYLLERREVGIINIGSRGTVNVDGKEYVLDRKDGLYVGMGTRDIQFSSENPKELAKFYLNCATAHKTYPTEKIELSQIEPIHLGSTEEANKRILYKYIHPDGIKSCQLVMGLTTLEPGNVWNTMPCHTHVRRMEVYLYFDIKEDAVVFHLLGEPTETRHIVVRNEEAVISPSWSIHSGVGTRSYTFIWGMVGENQTFADMDEVPIKALK